MPSTTFVSSWIAPDRCSFRNTFRTTCPIAPSMTLLSHEKLEVLSTTKDTEVAKYKLEIEIPAQFSKDKRRQSIQGMKKHANFPGFRKGTLPPYVMNQIYAFVLRDASNDMIEEALRDLDLSKVDGDEGEPEMDMDQMSSTFEIGNDFTFTCKVQTKQVLTEAAAEDLEDIVSTDIELEKVDMFKDREEEGATA